MDEKYLLTTPMAQRLYFETAKQLPLIDYHNHLSAADIAADRHFSDVAEIWLLGDPYKHRAMRICGVPEELISGGAGHKEKFRAWCEVYPKLMGGPLYDWSRMELEEVFGVKLRINGENAEAIWEQVNERLSAPELSAQGLLRGFNVEYAAPCAALTDDLSPFACSESLAPSLRGDDLLCPKTELLDKLAALEGVSIKSFDEMIGAMSRRMDRLAEAGCRFSDHALDNGFRYIRDDGRREERFSRLVRGELSAGDELALRSDMLRALGDEYARRGWVMQLHIGAQRFTSTRLRRAAGAAGGFACIGGGVDVESLAALLDDLEQGAHGLPKTILYTLNPADNAVMSVLSGSFIGVTQGPAWWWCDHLQGMREMLDVFSCFSVLSTFPGMTTDSRSLLSMLRHDYFRRCFCGWAGERAARGELPGSFEELSGLVKAVCYGNAKKLAQL